VNTNMDAPGLSHSTTACPPTISEPFFTLSSPSRQAAWLSTVCLLCVPDRVRLGVFAKVFVLATPYGAVRHCNEVMLRRLLLV
jgi:hypothetical protein